MNKLLALISSVSVCVSAFAVSFLSYFPSPVKVGASASSVGLNQRYFSHNPADNGGEIEVYANGGYLSLNPQTRVEPATNMKFSDLETNVKKVFWEYTYYTTSGGDPISSQYGENGFNVPIEFQWYIERTGTYTFRQGYTINLNSSSINYYLAVLGISSTFWYGLEQDHSFYDSISIGIAFNGRYSSNPGQYTGIDVHGSVLTLTGQPLQLEQKIFKPAGDVHYAFINKDSLDSIYENGREQGHSEGYTAGDSAGYARGVADGSSQFGMWDLFSNAFGSIGNILSIQLFPGLSIGLLLSVPIAFAFILWLIHVIKG